MLNWDVIKCVRFGASYNDNDKDRNGMQIDNGELKQMRTINNDTKWKSKHIVLRLQKTMRDNNLIH